MVTFYAVLPNFPEGRKKLVESFSNASQAASTISIGRDVCYDLFDLHIPDARFRKSTQQKVISYFFRDEEEILFNLIETITNQGVNEKEQILKYAGIYRYFRNNVQGIFVDGCIRIFREGSFWRFHHYNSSFSPRLNIEKFDHKGFVAIMGDRLYLIGIGPRYIRPIVARTVDDPHKDRVEGVVISVQKRGGDLFSARFIMIHEKHEEFISPNSEEYRQIIDAQNGIAGVLMVGGH